MTVMEFFGCALLAFGPPLAMFTFTVAVEPIRIIILIASAFFWLIALLLSAILWYVVVPLQNELAFGLVFSVLFQEAFRFLLYWVLRNAERGLEKVTTAHVAESRHVFAYVCGLGFGVMSGAFALVNVLADAIGPGTMGLHQGSEYFFIVSATTTLCFILLHTFWGIIFFAALDRRSKAHLAWVVGSHLFASCMTLLNRYEIYAVSLISAYSVLVATVVIAFRIVGGKAENISRCFSLK
ncbi:gamma-secretase subunit Aph-1 [Neodiprion pinetum]|uniref:Gamma-secretase subunit Aph-1 n=1 Tax=Neodiprion lecontei TaxID=441921 RepID=A0A6J0BYK0_NEOLC|nr:gamma-secretase subunit Aph-1 [Neodiprion lecontei]XP_046418021.1 gamma-secretase subunit Aph-1 [Neodiprion fabricii]XP_046473784.1 gamma-secretase subunit Aph-1 [Neodiprion pinetum]XP_046611395.1 gamma-secretase subunit Aph-1 [Neodiprion virginianus]